MRRIAERLGVLCAVVCAAGCNSGQMTPPPPPITVAVAPASVAMAAGATTQFTATVTNDSTNAGVTWSVNGVAGGNSATGTIDGNGNFTAPAASASVTITATSKKDASKSANATANAVAKAAACAPTLNPQVCQLTIRPAAAANVSVQFSTDPAYPQNGTLTTWEQAAPAGGGAVSIFVAGMKANTPYHLRGVVKFADGTTFTDADQTFTTGSIPAAQLPVITVSKPGTPQSGVEALNMVGGAATVAPVAITDTDGNILWSYNDTTLTGVQVNPVKLLSNGHFLINFSSTSVDGQNSTLREVDLGGNTLWQLTTTDLNNALAAATCSGCNIVVLGTHHDFLALPNGHLIVLASTQNQQVVAGAIVTGDVVIDLDQNHKPVWVWNEFNFPTQLPITRQPMGFPDWTHTNAVIYSKDDKNLIVSIRHQNWLVKINYNDGAGDGSIVWRLGFQGDFTLEDAQGNADNTDTHWFFAQHGPSFTTDNTTGQFGLVLFDNGDDRNFAVTQANGSSCGGAAPLVACASNVPMLQIDETAKTAKLTQHPAAAYSLFGGNAEVLKNGNVEYCESASGPGTAGDVFEITTNGTLVWNLHVTGQFVYRGMRLPSLYPGVQW